MYGMLFGKRAATEPAPLPDSAPPHVNGDATPLEVLRLQPEGAKQIERDVALLADELVWLKERFGKLQNRVTAELREIRREVDRLYEEPDLESEE
jgi:hypothetical protein